MTQKIQKLFVKGNDTRDNVIVTFGGRNDDFAEVPPYIEKPGILDLKSMRDFGKLSSLFLKEFLGDLK